MAFGNSSWHFSTMTLLRMSLMMMVVICWLGVLETEARPNWALPTVAFIKKFKEQSQCDHDSDLLELCQRCAKATKSNFAYPMCCADQEGAISWCKDYIYFGIQ